MTFFSNRIVSLDTIYRGSIRFLNFIYQCDLLVFNSGQNTFYSDFVIGYILLKLYFFIKTVFLNILWYLTILLSVWFKQYL